MEPKIFYYSGTGNCLFVAKTLAQKINGQHLNIFEYQKEQEIDSDVIGFVFPCYAYTYPKILNKLIKQISFSKKPKFVFCIITYGSTFGRAGIQFVKRLEKTGLKADYMTGILMPENYIAIFKPDRESVIDTKLHNAKVSIDKIAQDIINRVQYFEQHNRLLDYIKTAVVGTIFNGFLNFSHIFFKANKSCSSCGICVKVCQVNNIVIKNGKPKWKGHCTQCMACLNWCPQKCIDYTPITKKRERYTNPEVTLKELYNKTIKTGQGSPY